MRFKSKWSAFKSSLLTFTKKSAFKHLSKGATKRAIKIFDSALKCHEKVIFTTFTFSGKGEVNPM